MALTPTPQKPFDILVIDTIGPLPKSNNGNIYALTMICDMSKYLITVPLCEKTAISIARAIFENFILVYGPCAEIRSDMGTEFKNEVIAELCKLMRISQKFSTPYHHQTVGSVERNHRFFNEYLRSFVNDLSNWDEYLSYFTFLYNVSKHSSFQNKFSPYEIIFGKTCNLFEFIHNKIDPIYNFDDYIKQLKFKMQYTNDKCRKLLDKLKITNKKQYDKNVKITDFAIGDRILVKKEPYDKFKNIYQGPFEIIEQDECNVIVQIGKNKKEIHKNRIVKA